MSRIKPDNFAAMTEKFTSRSEEMINQYGALKNRGSLRPYASKWGTFKREAYTLIRKTKGEPGGHNVIKGIVMREQVDPARLNYRGNEFHFGLLAIDPAFAVLDKKKVSLFARQMTYADLHDVPDYHLIGFLYQSGNTAEITKKLKAGTRESWFGRR